MYTILKAYRKLDGTVVGWLTFNLNTWKEEYLRNLNHPDWSQEVQGTGQNDDS